MALALLVGALIVFVSIDYIQPDFNRGFLIGKEPLYPYFGYALYAHMLGAPLALFTGIYQFTFTRSRAHQVLGKVYTLSILLLAAPSGLYMSFWAIGGTLSTINFLLMSAGWWWFTWQAFRQIKKGNVAQHRRFMTRSFILTNSAIMIRLFSFVNNHYELTDVTTGYMIIAWISWLPWLLIYELSLLRKQRSANLASHA